MKIGTIRLSDHFSYGRLLRFTLPSIAMMIFTSVYGVVDGFFVSNFVGKQPFAAVNFIMPFLMILGTVGFMLGTGGSALVAKTLGEGKRERAEELFTLFVLATAVLGLLTTVGGIALLRPVARLLGAEGELLEMCVSYGRIVLCALVPFMLQIEFQSFFVTAERPKLGLYVTLAAGVTNMVLDALLVGIFPLGLAGAAWATAISQAVGGLVPLVYFARPNASLLRFRRPRFDGSALLRATVNGSSELMSNVSMSLVGMLYNLQLMRYAGEDGVAAYGVLMYVNMIFLAVFIGYSVGVAPVVGYHFGAGGREELASVRRKSTLLILLSSLAMTLLAEAFGAPLSRLFVGYDPTLFALTARGFFIFSLSFLFSGIAIFGSSFFTALNNGGISALISFLRTLVFQIAAVWLLPLWLETDGIWLSCVVAEVMAAAVTLVCIMALRRRYGY